MFVRLKRLVPVWLPVVPLLVFVADDILSHWHHHGRDSTLHIILENMAEDAGAACFLAWLWWNDVWQSRPIPHWHCTCPQCGHAWVMHPRHPVQACPRCGLPEPKPDKT